MKNLHSKLSGLLLALFMICVTQTARAQDMTTPLLDGTWQSTFSNPALLHRLPGKLTIGLPGGYNDLFVENITYNDLLVEEDGSTFLDPNQAIGLLEAENELRDQFDFETLGLAVRGERWAIGFSHRLRYDATINYPKALAQVIWQGNAQFIGQTVEIAPALQIFGYHELGVTAAYKVNDILTIGGRIKYLSGISDVSTPAGGSLQLTTDDLVYDLTLDQNYTVNSAGVLNYEGLDEIETTLEFANITMDQFLGQNNGFGFDLGAHLDFGNLRVQASALDLGAGIDWSDDVRNYVLSGTEEFTGLDVLQSLLDDSASFSGLLDSLEAQFEPTETNVGYRTDIGGSYLLGGEFDLSDAITLGALLYYRDKPLTSDPAVSFSGRYRFGKRFIGGATYSYRAGSAANLGLNMVVGIGPVDFVAATDNIVTAFTPQSSNRANVRLGLSLSLLRDNE